MKYELVKKLRDAGFPYDWQDFDNHFPDLLVVNWDIYSKFYSPTLSEIIEACGENIKNIDFVHGMNLFIAYSMESLDKKGEGITTEEAIANLWLELNKDISSKITEL